MKVPGIFYLFTVGFEAWRIRIYPCSVRERCRQPYTSDQPAPAVKLSQDDVERICQRVVDHDMDTSYVAQQFDITRRHVQRLAKAYRETGNIPILETPGRKPYAEHPPDLKQRVLDLREQLDLGAVAIAHILRHRDGISIANNKVNEILLRHAEARVNRRKQGRRRPWVRFERCLSGVTLHMDWYHNNAPGEW